ncbi:MAG: efflux RND transporter permease subunit [Aeromicrobium sp.]
MISATIRGALKFRGLVVAIAGVLVVLGLVTLPKAPVDLFPEFTPPYVEIQTESLGLSAAEVEEFLTTPIEADLLNGIEGVEVIRSKSTAGLSSIVLVFEQGFDVYKGRQLVQERLTQLNGAAFPHVSRPPVVLPPLSSSSRVMMIGLSAENLSPIQKSVIARWTIKPRLLGIQGVSDVNIWGMRDQQIQVQVDPDKLRKENVSLSQIISTAGNAQVASPVSYLEASVPGTGGFIETPAQRLPIRNVFDNIASPETLGQVPIEETGGKLQLSDVANVVEEHQPLIGDAVVNDGDGLLLVVEKFPGANTREITKQIEDELNDLSPGLAGMKADTSVFRPAALLDQAIHNVSLTLSIAGVVLLLAFVAFIRVWRRILVTAIAVPVALISAAFVLVKMGETLNSISIIGLALALVVIVDDSVVGAENVARRLRERKDATVGQVVLEATHEVRRPIAYATVMGVAVTMPLIVMEGRPGAFYTPLATAFILALLAGTVVALTLVPALTIMFPSRETPSAGWRKVRAWHSKILTRALNKVNAVFAIVAAATVIALATMPLVNNSFVPTVQDRDVLVRLQAPTGTSNTRMTAIATELSKKLRGIDGVGNVGAAVGRAITGDRIVDVNSGEMIVSMESDADYDETMAAIQKTSNSVKGADTEVTTYSDQRIRDVGGVTRGENLARGGGLDVMTGVARNITVRVYGQNLDVLKKEAARIQKVVAGVDGVATPTVEEPEEQATIEIEVDLEKALKYGLKPGDVRRSEAVMLQGILVGSVFKDQKVFDVVVKGKPELAENVDSLKDLLIDSPDGGKVRLSEVADVRPGRTPVVIDRDAVSRKLDITADVKGRSVSAVADELETRLRGLDMPLEYHAEVLDRTVDEEVNFGDIVLFGVGATIATLLLFQALLRSWRLAAASLFLIPAALAGGVVATLALADGLTLGAAAGLLGLFALTTRQIATTFRHYQDLERDEGEHFGVGLIKKGIEDRTPALVTTLVSSAAALLPFALIGPRVGLENLHPMALVILGGLISVAAVNFIAVPVFYMRVRKGQKNGVKPEDDLDSPLTSTGAAAR